MSREIKTTAAAEHSLVDTAVLDSVASGRTDTAVAAASNTGIGIAVEIGPVAKDTDIDDAGGIADIGTAEMAADIGTAEMTADIRPADEAARNFPLAEEDTHIVVTV